MINEKVERETEVVLAGPENYDQREMCSRRPGLRKKIKKKKKPLS